MKPFCMFLRSCFLHIFVSTTVIIYSKLFSSHCISLVCSCDSKATQFGICEIVTEDFWQIIFWSNGTSSICEIFHFHSNALLFILLTFAIYFVSLEWNSLWKVFILMLIKLELCGRNCSVLKFCKFDSRLENTPYCKQ